MLFVFLRLSEFDAKKASFREDHHSMTMVESILRSLRTRRRRSGNIATKQVKEANTVNMAIENELALLNNLQSQAHATKKTSLISPLKTHPKSPRKSNDDNKSPRKPLSDINKLQQPVHKKDLKMDKG
ncbi:hypothetical protein GCK32_012745 [Trichostrongylus colubriformis]|uniref:Uncharacterized protein n=1 Tax=Trichostrongylus colubriformis TaxID=6319 RepID=A0AAN8F7D5_TRICO